MANIKGYGIHSKVKAKEHVIEFSVEFDEEVTAREAEDLIYELLNIGHQCLNSNKEFQQFLEDCRRANSES